MTGTALDTWRPTGLPPDWRAQRVELRTDWWGSELRVALVNVKTLLRVDLEIAYPINMDDLNRFLTGLRVPSDLPNGVVGARLDYRSR